MYNHSFGVVSTDYLVRTSLLHRQFMHQLLTKNLQLIGGKMGKSEGLGDGSKQVDFGNYTVWVGLTQKCLFQFY